MEIQYQNRIVAFIDVLGFSNLVYSDTTEKINTYFNFVLNDFERAAQRNNFDYILISDSIVIATENDKEHFNQLVKVIFKLQQKFMEDAGILIRGGISFGELYFDKTKNIVVGKGLINAYKLEGQAKYPRIILDRQLIPLFFECTHTALKENKLLTYVPPQPYHADFIYLNYPQAFSFSNQQKKFSMVLSLLKENYYKNEHIEKYEWLKIHIKLEVDNWYKYLVNKENKSRNEMTRYRLTENFKKEIDKL